MIPGSLYNPSISQFGGFWTLTSSFGAKVCTGSVWIYSGAPDSPQTWSGSAWVVDGGVLPWTTFRAIGVDAVMLTSTNGNDWSPFATNHFEIPSVQPQQFFRSVLTISQPQ